MSVDTDRGGNSRCRVFGILNRIVIIGLTGIILTSCMGSPNRAPVHDRFTQSAKKPSYHIVSKGETLFSIAWRYGVDYKQLAKQNGISSSYIIYPGQKIYLYKTVAKSPAASVKKSPQKAVDPAPVRPPVTPSSRSKTTTASKNPPPAKSTPSAELQWRWPAQGKVIATFSSQNTLNKGIDIEGRLGEPVLAAASGVVVYAGNGIRGYGNLLIIKHNETYLSAYAHNSKLLVKEQTVVKVGEKIAEIGQSGADKPKLHFEIRRAGKPIDPRNYLPRR